MKSARLQNLLERKGAIALFFVALLCSQLLYSFRFPSVGHNANWLPVTNYLPKFSVESSDNFLLKTIYPLISSEYRLNSDVGEYLVAARNFSSDYLEGHQYLNRPLYPFLIFLSSRIIAPAVSPSYGVLFGLAMIINFFLITVTVLLFFTLLQRFFPFRIAFFSSLLLVFSPFVHSFLTQPMPEMLTAFGVMFSLYLLSKYLEKPRFMKLISFSFLGGIMMLGKMFFATPLLILALALYFKRYRDGAVFAACFAIPAVLWYLWVTRIWGISYYVLEVQAWNMGVWLLSIFELPGVEILKIFVQAIPNFISALFHSFIFIPVIFAFFGFGEVKDRAKKFFAGSFIASVFILAFLINLYLYRHAFMLFPIVYPLTILGIEKAGNYFARFGKMYNPIFKVAAFAAIIAVSSINIYRFYYYLN